MKVKMLDIYDDMDEKSYRGALTAVSGLSEVTGEEWPDAQADDRFALMEFIIEGLHQNFLITKMVAGKKSVYTDTVSHMMGQMDEE